MKVKITLTGHIDVPEVFTTTDDVVEQTEFWFNEHLSCEDAIDDIAKRLKSYPDDMEVTVELEEVF